MAVALLRLAPSCDQDRGSGCATLSGTGRPAWQDLSVVVAATVAGAWGLRAELYSGVSKLPAFTPDADVTAGLARLLGELADHVRDARRPAWSRCPSTTRV
jgi:hypothetical protein